MTKIKYIGLAIILLAAVGLVIGQSLIAQDKVSGDIQALIEVGKVTNADNAGVISSLIDKLFQDEFLGSRYHNTIEDFAAGITIKDVTLVDSNNNVTPTTLTLAKYVNTLMEFNASSTPLETSTSTYGNPITAGYTNIQVINKVGANDYINLPEINGTTVATGTPSIVLHWNGIKTFLNTASTTAGVLQKINNGAAGATASTTIPATVLETVCTPSSATNWYCVDHTIGQTASSSYPSSTSGI